MNLDTSMLSRINQDQLAWVNKYIQSIEETDGIEEITLANLTFSKAVQMVTYYDYKMYIYTIDIDGIALRRDSE